MLGSEAAGNSLTSSRGGYQSSRMREIWTEMLETPTGLAPQRSGRFRVCRDTGEGPDMRSEELRVFTQQPAEVLVHAGFA